MRTDGEITHKDRAELDRFRRYCLLIAQAEAAGVPGNEAAIAIYPDVYGTEPECDCAQCAPFRSPTKPQEPHRE